MLRGVGFEHASLFFQWTWHTPEVPEGGGARRVLGGPDGSRLVCATRNRLNLHQWPEDFQILLDDLAANPPQGEGPTPLVLQWLEPMPSRTGMCRSEIMLPKLKELKEDPRFDVRFATLGEYLGVEALGRLGVGEDSSPTPQRLRTPQRPSCPALYHGRRLARDVLGKNGDRAPRASHYAERCLLSAESLNVALGLLAGRTRTGMCIRRGAGGVHGAICSPRSTTTITSGRGFCGHVAEPQHAAVTRCR